MKELKKVLELEKSVQEMLSELLKNLSSNIEDKPLDGVTQIGKHAASVSMSSIQNTILSPSYYIQSCQAEAVEKKLEKVKTATHFVEEVKKMVKEKRVKNGSDVVMLNTSTIKVLNDYVKNI